MKSQVLILNCESLFSYMILRKNLISFYYISVSPRSMWKLWFNKILGFISLQIGSHFGIIRSWKGPFLAGIFRSHQHCGFIWWDFAKIKNNFEGWTEIFPTQQKNFLELNSQVTVLFTLRIFTTSNENCFRFIWLPMFFQKQENNKKWKVNET